MIRAGLNTIKELSRLELIRFLAVGIFCVLVEFILFIFLVDTAGLKYTQANLLAMAVSVTVNYFLTRKMVFAPGRYNAGVTFGLFVVFTLVGAFINQFLLWFLVEKIYAPLRLSKILAIGTAAGFNYLAKKHVVFRK